MLTSEYLISPILSQEALGLAGPDKVLTTYFHQIPGSVSVGLGTPNPQHIIAVDPPQSLIDHANLQYRKISDIVDVGFKPVDNSSDADISIYFDSEIVLSPFMTF